MEAGSSRRCSREEKIRWKTAFVDTDHDDNEVERPVEVVAVDETDIEAEAEEVLKSLSPWIFHRPFPWALRASFCNARSNGVW